ncbi:TIR domain-containing protein [Thermosipho globiformans]|uniref:TIR domain-containing protein n=1 Tax=Thermosipho globiformans TaxID=380685 RepID=UPI000F8C900B|nr:TIR domain-containing protein [Thermosipho globiformans]
MSSKIYDLFISHAWDYKEDYYNLREKLNNYPYFEWRDYSVPFHDPIESINAQTIKSKIREKIRQSSVFIVFAAMYSKYSDWIEWEVKVAEQYEKPILAIKPWSQEKVPVFIQEKANKIVGWNIDNIVSAIRELAK